MEQRLMVFSKERKALKIILDSNAFFVPQKLKIDIFNELRKLLSRNFKMILLSKVKIELETLSRKGSPSMRKKAAYALKLAERVKVCEVDSLSSAPTDDVIMQKAKEWNALVFTNDKELKKRLRDISVPVIYVRQKSRLEIDGMI
jgi:rRNA-processing protein FCF1